MAGSDRDDVDSVLSRDGSFFSLTSTNSVYMTAEGSLAESLDSTGLLASSSPQPIPAPPYPIVQQTPPTIPLTVGSLGSKTSSSSTLAEGESLVTDEELMAFLSPESEDIPFKYNFLEEDQDGRSPSGGSSEAMAENGEGVKADVSRICNALAESIHPNTLDKQERIERVLEMMENGERHALKELKELATSEHGLLSNTLRKRAWPYLIGIPSESIRTFETRKLPKKQEVVAEEIKNLVHMDVARVLKRFPPGLSDPQQDHLLTTLTTLICSVLEKNPGAYYYQGFHDISLTFLLVCISQSAPYLAYLCLNKMVETSLAPFMEVTMDATHDLIHVVFSIIEKEDPALFNKIVKENKCPVAFCLPWVLTWFSHTLPHDSDIFRVYDFVLGCTDEVKPPCLIPIFTSAALILRNSKNIQRNVREKDIASMHQALSLLPSEQQSLEPWLKDSLKLMKKYGGMREEEELRCRAVKIKEIQFELWSEDTNNNRGRGRVGRNAGSSTTNPLRAIGRFVFVRHRWVTVALVVLGTAVLLQSRYDLSSKLNWSILHKYIPQRLQRLCTDFMSEVEFEGFSERRKGMDGLP